MSRTETPMWQEIGMIFLVSAFSALAGYQIGLVDREVTLHKARVEAVEHGYAEWVPDTEGKTTFTWKEKQ